MHILIHMLLNSPIYVEFAILSKKLTSKGSWILDITASKGTLWRWHLVLNIYS
jgi:hypothetical protein